VAVPTSSSATQSSINSLLPPGGYIITQRSNETILLTAEQLRANTLATSAGSTAEVHAQLFIKGNKNCKITVLVLGVSSFHGISVWILRPYVLLIHFVVLCLVFTICSYAFLRPSLLGSVRIEFTSDCEIYLGACCTSVYLESVHNCTIYILTHQLRIHTCADCKLFVRANSHPIIEDCVNMGFGQYSYEYETLEADIQVCLCVQYIFIVA